MSAPTGATWLASYPKSGNTWLRLLLEAYRTDSVVDPNDNRIAVGDAGKVLIRSASPLSLEDLGDSGEFLVRPSGLMNLFVTQSPGYMVKTHFANLYPLELPPFIPPQITKRAIYMVRDPRDVCVSFSRYYGHSQEMTCDIMAQENYIVGGDGEHAKTYLSSWSAHVASWVSEKRYPVHVVRYEDMVADTAGELRKIVEFVEWEVDDDRAERAVENCLIERMQDLENRGGFRENPQAEPNSRFFNGGGSRWRDELAKKWACRIERDHCKVMEMLNYLDDNVVNIDELKVK